MNNNQTISESLLEAYRHTNYEVYGETDFTLKIDADSETLKQLYQNYGVESAAFITAFNPFSKTLTEQENKERNEALLEAASAYKVISGRGVSEDGHYSEDSFLMLGIGLDKAKALGKQFEQNAILWIDKDAVPQLILLR